MAEHEAKLMRPCWSVGPDRHGGNLCELPNDHRGGGTDRFSTDQRGLCGHGSADEGGTPLESQQTQEVHIPKVGSLPRGSKHSWITPTTIEKPPATS